MCGGSGGKSGGGGGRSGEDANQFPVMAREVESATQQRNFNAADFVKQRTGYLQQLAYAAASNLQNAERTHPLNSAYKVGMDKTLQKRHEAVLKEISKQGNNVKIPAIKKSNLKSPE